MTPLFKVQKQTEMSTQQLVSAKVLSTVDMTAATPKKQSDTTLKLLLQGKAAAKQESSVVLTSDFSVATAKVVAPTAKSEATKSLESLLQGEKSDEGTASH